MPSQNESSRLKNDDYQKKADMSAGQPRRDLLNNRALKKVGLLATLGAECAEENAGGVRNQ